MQGRGQDGLGCVNATNDIEVVWPPARPPIIKTAVYVEADASYSERESVLAEVGRTVPATGRSGGFPTPLELDFPITIGPFSGTP